MAVGIICEFNPFHNGHKYLIETAKNLTGEPAVAVMSGSFTQRGEAAIEDKFSRAQAALKNGVDLVLELPAVFAVSGAESFAKAGVSILEAFDDMNYLAFGCENDDLSLLKKAAGAGKNKEVQKLILSGMKDGGYYPKVYEDSVRNVLGDETADILKLPNNILAVEYIRSLGEKITPLPIKRKGVNHDSGSPNGSLASASYIRKLLRAGQNAERFYPHKIAEVTRPENLETAALYKLRSMSLEEIKSLPDVSEGLENRIFSAVRNYNSVEEIISEVKTKRYTHARLRRIIVCALLGITREMQSIKPCYARVLGFTKAGEGLLGHCRLPVITSAKKGLELSNNVRALLKKDILATDIAALAFNPPKKCGTDFTSFIIKE